MTTISRFVVASAAVLAFAVSAQAQEPADRFTISVQTANIRSLPSIGSPVIGRAEKGAELQIIGRQEGWLEVVFTDGSGSKKVGYVAAWLGNMKKVQVPGTVTAVQAERPVQATPVVPVVAAPPAQEWLERNYSASQATSKTAQTTQVAVQPASQSDPHRFGVGIFLGTALGGVAPSVLYDMSDRITLNVALGLYAVKTNMTGELLYGFPQPANPKSDVTFKPYVGGGLVVVLVNYGVGSGSHAGLGGSGGTFLTVKKIPKWRFSGDLNLVHFNGNAGDSSIGLRLGAHYFF